MQADIDVDRHRITVFPTRRSHGFVDERDDVLTAPRAAIKRESGRQYVVLQRGGEWVEQDVRTGWRSDSTVELLSGVSAGDVVEINSY